MIYTHVLNRGARGVQSPLDRLERQPAEPDYTAGKPGVITARLQAADRELQSGQSDSSVEVPERLPR